MKLDYDIEGQGVVQLVDCLIGGIEAPTKARQLGWDTALKRPTVGDGSATQVLATQKDVSGLKSYRGDFSAKSGALPTINSGTKYIGEAFASYVKFFITEAGTITNIKGDTNLKIGAFLHLIGDDPALAASWYGENNDDADLTPYIAHGDTVHPEVAASTEVLIAPPAKIKTITGYQLFLSDRTPWYPEIVNVVFSGAGIGVRVKSLTAKTNVIIKFTGYLG
ncbi:MAG: hypothetical protein ACRC62_03575 [Microcoleus sp.]